MTKQLSPKSPAKETLGEITAPCATERNKPTVCSVNIPRRNCTVLGSAFMLECNDKHDVKGNLFIHYTLTE